MRWASISDSGMPKAGSEGGEVMLDEEHEHGARITLERGAPSAAFAITCGIYGWMVHTRFFTEEHDARQAFDEMKIDLEGLLDNIPLEADLEKARRLEVASRAIFGFVAKHRS